MRAFTGHILSLFPFYMKVPYTLSIKLVGSESALSGIASRSKCGSGWYYHL
jgi:hypothetical protein